MQGVAAEFLNLNTADPSSSNTRCGVSFDNRNTASPLPSPRGGTIVIVNPANAAGTAAQYGLWSLSRSYSTASRTALVTYSIADLNQALTNCGWLRDERNTATTLFRAAVRVTTVQQGRSVRGTLFSVTKETVVELAIAALTGVSASVNFEAQSGVIVGSEVIKQVFDPVQRSLSLLLFTSSQGPYQLRAISTFAQPVCSASSCAPWASQTGATLLRALLQDDLPSLAISAHATGVSSTAGASDNWRAQCFKPDAANNGLPAVVDYTRRQNSAAPFYDPCGQYWFLQLRPDQPGNLCSDIFADSHVARTAAGAWTATFDVLCHPTYGGACTAPGGGPAQPQVCARARADDGVRSHPEARAGVRQVTLTLSTSSDDYCPRLVDSVTVRRRACSGDCHAFHCRAPCAQSSLSLAVYDDFARTRDNSQFVFGTERRAWLAKL
jgi:hypothetical protein